MPNQRLLKTFACINQEPFTVFHNKMDTIPMQKTHMKSAMDTTSAGTRFETTQPRGKHFGAKQSKIDEAYWKARELIDNLIVAVQDKRDAARMGIKNVGDTNQYTLDQCQENDFFREVQISHPAPTDPQSLKIWKQVEQRKQQNLQLSRRCQALQNQNSYLKQSQASTKHANSRWIAPPTPKKVMKLQVPQQQFQQPRLVESRLFTDLQNLKQEGQELRQSTLTILRSIHH